MQLADNPDTWLGFTDLVFVDPVATGYSRSAAGTEEADRAFFGVEKDAEAMADFVRLYLTRAGRMLAPVFLVGESYGGFRAGLVADGCSPAALPCAAPCSSRRRSNSPCCATTPTRSCPWRWRSPPLPPRIWSRATAREGSLDSLAEVERFARERYLVHLASGLKNDPEVERALARYTGSGARRDPAATTPACRCAPLPASTRSAATAC